MTNMTYRRLGSAGLKVSTLSFGSWVTFDGQLDDSLAMECMQAAYDAGVNFFDNADGYASGGSEAIMGRSMAALGWERHSYVVSTKLYFGMHEGVNSRMTLNRKYLLEGIEESLDRLQHNEVDLLFCHRCDTETPMEEIVHTMHEIVESGRAYYWGTSEWTAEQWLDAWNIADRHGWHKPQMDQPQYNMMVRDKVETEFLPCYEKGMGTTIWSPLASGVLTGKYLDGVPEDSRAALAGYEWLAENMLTEDKAAKVRNLVPIAAELDCSMAQLAIAWCAANPNVSTVITGASRVSQVHENMAAMDVLEALTPEVMDRIATAMAD